MSGTSADAVDAVLIECSENRFDRVVARLAKSYPVGLRARILALGSASDLPSLEAQCEIDAAIGEVFATAAMDLVQHCALAPSDIEAIGSHGQTIFHRGGGAALTLQLGDANRIRAATGITTVADLRRADIALGGQGAPLVPAFHHAVFACQREVRAVLNLGGICNLSLLPDDTAASVRGFDVGPGNALLDEWSLKHRGTPFDAQGRLAASGIANEPLIEALAADPFFAAPPPKSTGRGDFNLSWARGRFEALGDCPVADVQASFAELTARSIATAIHRHQPMTARLLVCGGGVENRDLMSRLQRHLGGKLAIESTARHGLDPQAVEGAAFAWLAMRTMQGLPGNLPAVTGARRTAILGAVYRA